MLSFPKTRLCKRVYCEWKGNWWQCINSPGEEEGLLFASNLLNFGEITAETTTTRHQLCVDSTRLSILWGENEDRTGMRQIKRKSKPPNSSLLLFCSTNKVQSWLGLLLVRLVQFRYLVMFTHEENKEIPSWNPIESRLIKRLTSLLEFVRGKYFSDKQLDRRICTDQPHLQLLQISTKLSRIMERRTELTRSISAGKSGSLSNNNKPPPPPQRMMKAYIHL